MNIAVINLKDLIRYMICFIAILIIVSLGMKKVFEQNKSYEIKEGILSKIQNSSFLYCLENEAAIFSSQEDTEEFEIKGMNLKEILNVELSMLPNLKENVETNEINNTENQETEIEQDEEVKLPETNVETKVIDEKNLKESFNATLSDVKIKNETKIKTLGNIVPDCWIYIQEPDVTMLRLQIFNNWSPYLVKDAENTVWIGLEYTCKEGDKYWNKT